VKNKNKINEKKINEKKKIPLWGWSGKPAGFWTENSSNKRNGSNWRTSGLPILLLTFAPCPSLYSFYQKEKKKKKKKSLVWLGWIQKKK